ncbi:MAG: MFS transporter [Chloroflexota bacterium]|nr:MFS transporter [Chloroflexota bacterium]MDE2970235.1 MFS transporter [Chloroflexota bacterium]
MVHHHHHGASHERQHAVSVRERVRQSVGSLRYRNFRLLWTTTIFSSSARWVQQVSLGWLAFDLTDSAALLGVLLFVYQAPTFAMSPLIGVMVDRVDRRKLFIISQVTMAMVAALLAVDIATGTVEVWHLYIFALISGFESAIIHVVRQVIIPAVVPRDELLNAISLNSAANTVTRIAGPFLAGLLIVALGVEANFFIQAALLACVAVAAFPLQLRAPETDTDEQAAGVSIRDDIAVALRFIWGIGVLRLLFAVEFLMLFLASPFTSFLPVWAENVLSLDADGLGALYAAAGIGSLLGALLLAAAGNVRRKGVLMLIAGVALGLAFLGLGSSSLLIVSMVLLAVMGATDAIASAINLTLVQSRVPDGLQGRVMSIFNMGHALIATGALIMGVIVDAIGIQAMTLGLGAIVAVLAVFALAALPTLRRA